MGWKNIKEHYQINHNVCVTSKGICIGSGFVHDLAVIDIKTGKVIENSTFNGFLRRQYPSLLDASDKEILQLINSQDTFKASLAVYTYDGGEIIEKQCEEYGYPDVTHDGEQMYNNTFFSEKKAAIECAKNSAAVRIEHYTENVDRFKADLKKARRRLNKAEMNFQKLEADLAELNDNIQK